MMADESRSERRNRVAREYYRRRMAENPEYRRRLNERMRLNRIERKKDPEWAQWYRDEGRRRRAANPEGFRAKRRRAYYRMKDDPAKYALHLMRCRQATAAARDRLRHDPALEAAWLAHRRELAALRRGGGVVESE